MRNATLLVTVLLLAGCVEISDEKVQRADSPEAGTTEQSVRAHAGPPSRTIPADEPCKERGGVRIIAYDASLVLLGRDFKDRSVEFCIDATGSIKNTTYVQY
jgi:hypothetical protein